MEKIIEKINNLLGEEAQVNTIEVSSGSNATKLTSFLIKNKIKYAYDFVKGLRGDHNFKIFDKKDVDKANQFAEKEKLN